MSYWQKCYHCLHYKSFWQLPMQPVMMILSNWQHNCFSEAQNLCIILCYELWAFNWFILLTKTFVSSLSDPHIWLMWPAVTFVRSLSDPDNKDIPGCLRVTYHTLRKNIKKNYTFVLLHLQLKNHTEHAHLMGYRADSRFAPNQWEMALLCNNVSNWLGTSLESALRYVEVTPHWCNIKET